MQGLPFYLFSERTDNNASNFNDSKGYLVNRQENQKTIYILLGILTVFVIRLALMVAGCYEENIKLFELLDRLTASMNMFLRQVVRQGRIPFEIATDIPNDGNMAAFDDFAAKLQGRRYMGRYIRNKRRTASHRTWFVGPLFCYEHIQKHSIFS